MIQIWALRSRLEKQPTDLRRRHHYLRDGTLDDANDTVIRRRLETYESETTPVLEFYRDKLTTIDATQAPVKVINEITSVILSLGRAGARDNAHECTVQKRSENLVPS